jgi:hypothetical protein
MIYPEHVYDRKRHCHDPSPLGRGGRIEGAPNDGINARSYSCTRESNKAVCDETKPLHPPLYSNFVLCSYRWKT